MKSDYVYIIICCVFNEKRIDRGFILHQLLDVLLNKENDFELTIYFNRFFQIINLIHIFSAFIVLLW